MKLMEKENMKRSSDRKNDSDESENEDMIYYEKNREFVRYKNYFISKHKYDMLMSSGADKNPLKEKFILSKKTPNFAPPDSKHRSKWDFPNY